MNLITVSIILIFNFLFLATRIELCLEDRAISVKSASQTKFITSITANKDLNNNETTCEHTPVCSQHIFHIEREVISFFPISTEEQYTFTNLDYPKLLFDFLKPPKSFS